MRSENQRKRGAAAMYSVFRQLGNGEFLQVATRDELERAVQLTRGLKALWPGAYLVQDSEGNGADVTNINLEFRCSDVDVMECRLTAGPIRKVHNET